MTTDPRTRRAGADGATDRDRLRSLGMASASDATCFICDLPVRGTAVSQVMTNGPADAEYHVAHADCLLAAMNEPKLSALGVEPIDGQAEAFISER
jgi:hypothetical protein